eukprot:6474556-Amphidinium_carterae.2
MTPQHDNALNFTIAVKLVACLLDTTPPWLAKALATAPPFDCCKAIRLFITGRTCTATNEGGCEWVRH